VVHQQGTVDVRKHPLRTLLDDERSDTQAGDELQELSRRRRIELRGGLVEKQERRLQCERRCQADALQLTTRDLGHGAIRKVDDTDLRQSIVCV
jgi:hypothetical protein